MNTKDISQFQNGIMEVIKPLDSTINAIISSLRNAEKTLNKYSKKAILIVEDSNIIRCILKHKLNMLHEEYIVFEATNGNEALLEVENIHSLGYYIEFLLVDIEMPEKNGIEFVEELEAGWSIIFFSAVIEKHREEIIRKFRDKHLICLVQKTGQTTEDVIEINKKILNDILKKGN